MYLTLMPYFEAVTTTIAGIVGFIASPDLYSSFSTLLRDVPVESQGGEIWNVRKEIFLPSRITFPVRRFIEEFQKKYSRTI